MTFNVFNEGDILQPIQQARRCLARWLVDEKLQMHELQRVRTSALMARYFHNEDIVTDELMMSFLRHYSGKRDVDMEDPMSVRAEIKDLLDETTPVIQNNNWQRIVNGISLCIIAAVVVVSIVHVSTWRITPQQQSQLKSAVDQVVHEGRGGGTHAAVWAKVKAPLGVRSYQEISYWDFNDVRAELSRLR